MYGEILNIYVEEVVKLNSRHFLFIFFQVKIIIFSVLVQMFKTFSLRIIYSKRSKNYYPF